MLEFLGLGGAANTTAVSAERDHLLVLKDVIHVRDGPLELHALGDASHFVSVLVVGTQV